MGKIDARVTVVDAGPLIHLLTDDAAARLAGESVGLHVHGTIGVLIRSIRSGRRSKAEVLSLLRGLPRTSSLHISRGLLDTVILQVSQEP